MKRAWLFFYIFMVVGQQRYDALIPLRCTVHIQFPLHINNDRLHKLEWRVRGEVPRHGTPRRRRPSTTERTEPRVCPRNHYISIISYYICAALNHRYSLKGLNRPYIYDPPLTLTPRGLEKTPLISEEEILRRNAERGFISAAVCTRRGHVSGFI